MKKCFCSAKYQAAKYLESIKNKKTIIDSPTHVKQQPHSIIVHSQPKK